MEPLFFRAGDILLYRPTGIFGRLIAVKTWHRIAHVEVYNGERKSYASRNGVGFNLYDTRMAQLTYVLRPTPALNLISMRTCAKMLVGTPYGWFDLLAFFGLPIDGPGIICSSAATLLLRAAGLNVFPTDAANSVAPFQFLDLVGSEFTIAYGPEELAKYVP